MMDYERATLACRDVTWWSAFTIKGVMEGIFPTYRALKYTIVRIFSFREKVKTVPPPPGPVKMTSPFLSKSGETWDAGQPRENHFAECKNCLAGGMYRRRSWGQAGPGSSGWGKPTITQPETPVPKFPQRWRAPKPLFIVDDRPWVSAAPAATEGQPAARGGSCGRQRTGGL